jgi:hypothetical protein
LAQHIGCNRFIIQSDNIQVEEAMLDGGFSATAATAIFLDCNILASGFSKVSYQFCPNGLKFGGS